MKFLVMFAVFVGLMVNVMSSMAAHDGVKHLRGEEQEEESRKLLASYSYITTTQQAGLFLYPNGALPKCADLFRVLNVLDPYLGVNAVSFLGISSFSKYLVGNTNTTAVADKAVPADYTFFYLYAGSNTVTCFNNWKNPTLCPANVKSRVVCPIATVGYCSCF